MTGEWFGLLCWPHKPSSPSSSLCPHPAGGGQRAACFWCCDLLQLRKDRTGQNWLEEGEKMMSIHPFIHHLFIHFISSILRHWVPHFKWDEELDNTEGQLKDLYRSRSKGLYSAVFTPKQGVITPKNDLICSKNRFRIIILGHVLLILTNLQNSCKCTLSGAEKQHEMGVTRTLILE